MKILYVSTGLDAGGAQMMLYQMLSKLDRQRFDPVVISLLDQGIYGDRIAALGIPVHALNMPPGRPTLAAIGQLRQLVQQLQPDLMQGWMYHGNLAAQLVRGLVSRSLPVIWSIHYSIDALASDKKMTAVIVKLGAYLSQLPRRILFVSHVSQSQHIALGYARDRSQVIPNGFEPSLFQPSADHRQQVRAELGVPEDCFLIGVAGRDHPMKDHPNFVQAAAILAADNPAVRFLMMGSGLTPDHPGLQALMTEYGIRDRIFCLGSRSDMPRLLASLDVFTSASAYGEAFPMVIGEAMACGVPCVVTDVGDSKFMVGATGKTVPPRDPQALAAAWQALIDLGNQARAQLGQTARDRVMAQFSLGAIVAQYESLYAQIMTS